MLQLDPRVALEAIMLNRLERTPAARRQEWLRGLLVQGFRCECQALRGASDEATPRSTSGFTNWTTGVAQKPISLSAEEPAVAKSTSSPVNTVNKPFAALGKVMG